MIIKNQRPIPTGIVNGISQTGSTFLAVLVKGTFSMSSTGTVARMMARQIPIFDADIPEQSDQPGGLLRFESDRVPFKPRADIIVVGNAYAPQGRPTRSLDVEIRVGSTGKVLRVFGERSWSYSPSQGVPCQVGPVEFVRMPLTYDRAFGGIDHRGTVGGLYPSSKPWFAQNIHGRGYIGARTAEAIHGRALPNIEDPQRPVASWDTCPFPAGCGFFPRDSETRTRYAGTRDERWKAERAPLPPVDFHFDLFNGAHPDLQVPNYLVGNEAVRLVHVDPSRPILTFRLPCIQPRLSVKRSSTVPSQQTPAEAFRLDTLVFIPDEARFYVVWRCVVSVGDSRALEIEELCIDYGLLAPANDPPEFFSPPRTGT